jgi:hypothetical protein
MKRMWSTAAIALALGAALGVGPALAADDKSHSGANRASADFSGRHTMEGEVTKVDQNKGKLSLKTAEGTLDLHFPPSALANVKKGDHVTVELAMKPSAGGNASPRSEGTPKSGGGGSSKY